MTKSTPARVVVGVDGSAHSDAAIAWANRCPGASHGIVEVRPVWQM